MGSQWEIISLYTIQLPLFSPPNSNRSESAIESDRCLIFDPNTNFAEICNLQLFCFFLFTIIITLIKFIKLWKDTTILVEMLWTQKHTKKFKTTHEHTQETQLTINMYSIFVYQIIISYQLGYLYFAKRLFQEQVYTHVVIEWSSSEVRPFQLVYDFLCSHSLSGYSVIIGCYIIASTCSVTYIRPFSKVQNKQGVWRVSVYGFFFAYKMLFKLIVNYSLFYYYFYYFTALHSQSLLFNQVS